MNIKVYRKNRAVDVQGTSGSSLQNILRENGIYINAACGGNGKCGTCKVRYIQNPAPKTPAEKRYFSEEDLNKGWRLACVSKPEEDCEIQIDSDEEKDFYVVSDHEAFQAENSDGDTEWNIGIDIGSTTIAMSLTGNNSKSSIASYSAVNKQRSYGSDVISRIQASNEGKKEELKECVRKEIYVGVHELLKRGEISVNQLKEVIIAGNTTMLHLLMGFSCETLGVYPFQPESLKTLNLPFRELFPKQQENDCDKELLGAVKVTLLPGISAFVGADISSGLLYCKFDRLEKPSLFIDLGTNGEMALGNKDHILTTSTAAGPAFEGGNITWGTGSIPGAICKVTINNEKPDCHTIGDKPPVGICGTGVIDIVYELLKNEIIDETGLLSDAYFETGFSLGVTETGEEITFTQQDIREVQLAKSAIRAGIEVLMKRYGVDFKEIEHVFLAGGFGYKIDIKKAVGIGMIPEELIQKIEAVGNSALAGTIVYAGEADALQMEGLIQVSKEINLSQDKDFNTLYMNYMMFE